MLINKWLAVDYGAYSFTGRGGHKRRFRHRHNRRVCNHYLQVGPVEVTVWYWDATRPLPLPRLRFALYCLRRWTLDLAVDLARLAWPRRR
jgi:hypothetical protein